MIVDDVLLVRAGEAQLLRSVGIEVVAECADAAGLLRAVALESPDAAIIDIRMPPTHTDEGLVAAQQIRRLHGRRWPVGHNVAQKLIAAHLVDGEMSPGQEIALHIDQTLTQDATGTMVMLELEALGLERARTELSVQYVDHNLSPPRLRESTGRTWRTSGSWPCSSRTRGTTRRSTKTTYSCCPTFATSFPRTATSPCATQRRMRRTSCTTSCLGDRSRWCSRGGPIPWLRAQNQVSIQR